MRDLDRDTEFWAAVEARDAAFDGRFVFAVRSTGIYCRPSCPAKRPKRENVAFFEAGAQARAAGYRACLRCKPDDTSFASQIEAACRALAGEEPPALEALAARFGLSASHFQRRFKEAVGLSPKKYAQALRSEAARKALTEKEISVTEALYDAGFGSSSRFYEGATERLGMTPTALRKGGAGERLRYALGGSSLGAVLVAASEKGVAAILMGDDPQALVDDLAARFPAAEITEGAEDFAALVAEVVSYIETPSRGLDLPLDIRGTAFQQRVWEALRAIPLGATANYTEIAHAIGAPSSSRAVAQACGANRHALAIPCHRVIRADGGLSGYRWGVARKEEILKREAEAKA